jgi:hypothetical protein
MAAPRPHVDAIPSYALQDTSTSQKFKELIHKPNRTLEENRLAFLRERLLTTKRKRVGATAPVRRLRWNQLVNHIEPIPGPWPDSRFAIHNANLRRGSLLASLMDASRPAGVGATFIGLDKDGKGLCINKGKGDKYQRIHQEAAKSLTVHQYSTTASPSPPSA